MTDLIVCNQQVLKFNFFTPSLLHDAVYKAELCFRYWWSFCQNSAALQRFLIYHVVEKWKEPLNISISLGDSEFSETFACNITAHSSFPENCTIFNWCNSTLAGKETKWKMSRTMSTTHNVEEWNFRFFCDLRVVDFRVTAFSQRMQDVRSPMNKYTWKGWKQSNDGHSGQANSYFGLLWWLW